VQVIILVEDNVRYYSSFLPVMYTELLHHSQRVIVEGLNLSQKILRMRARPKILLCTTWEEAERAFERYADEVLGIISDVEFPRAGEKVPRAGADFARQVRSAYPDVPIVLHSSRPENEALAYSVGADFLLKGSPLLLQELRDVMLERFGFGDFVSASRTGPRWPAPPTCGASRRSSPRCPRSRSSTTRAEPLLPLAQGAHRVHPRPRAAAAHARRLREPAGPPGEPDPGDRLVPARAGRTLVTDFDRGDFDLSGDFYRMGGGSLAARREASPSCGGCWPSRACATVSRMSRSRCRPRRCWGPTSSTAFSTTMTSATSRSSAKTTRRSSGGSGWPPSRGRPSATWPHSSSGPLGPWPCARRACSRTRSTSRSRASTTR